MSGPDYVGVNGANFGGGLGSSFLPDDYFVSGPGAAPVDNSHGYFLFDTDTHKLYWDADGSDAGAAQLLATFTNNATLMASDIFVFLTRSGWPDSRPTTSTAARVSGTRLRRHYGRSGRSIETDNVFRLANIIFYHVAPLRNVSSTSALLRGED